MKKEISSRHYDTLRRSVLFAGLTDSEMAEALRYFNGSVKRYARGEVLHQAGRPLKKFGLVLDGIVQVCTDDFCGNRMIMANVTSGKTFGEAHCFLKSKEPGVYMQAAEASHVVWLDLVELNPEVKKGFAFKMNSRFTAMLAERTLAMNSRIQALSKLTLREKLITYFTDLSEEAGADTFIVPLNREDMAAYLGANRSALSRELSLMKRDGLIDYYKSTVKILKKQQKK